MPYKKILCLLITISLVFSILPATGFAEENFVEVIKISPSGDTYVRGRVQSNLNFHASNTMVVDVGRERRFGYISFSMSDVLSYMPYAESIKLYLTTAGDAENKEFVVYPLYGAHKTVDTTEMTFTSAGNCIDNGVSLVDYAPVLDDEFYRETKKSTQYAVDVTDYVKSQTDGVIAFKLDAVSDPFSICSSETVLESQRPYIEIICRPSQDFDLAQKVADEVFATPVIDSDVSLPTSVGGAEIEWKSESPQLITNDGRVNRPGIKENDATAKMSATIIESVFEKTVNYEFTILKEGSFAHDRLAVADNIAFVGFDLTAPEFAQSNGGLLLNLPDGMLKSGKTYLIYGVDSEIPENIDEEFMNGGTLLYDIAAGSDTYSAEIDISSFLQSGMNYATFCIVSTDETEVLSWNDFPRINVIPVEGAVVHDALNSIALGDLSNVTESLVLPQTFDGMTIQWISSNVEVISASGRVRRPKYTDGDATVVLTAVIETDVYKWEKSFETIVKKEERTGDDDYPELRDPMHMSDETFFGVWDNETLTWTTTPILRYDKFSELNIVEEEAKKGDYDTAKTKLLDYYRARTHTPDYWMTPNYNFSLDAEMLVDKVLGFGQTDSLVGVFTVTPEWEKHTIEIPTNSLDNTYFFVGSEVDGTQAVIPSRENLTLEPVTLEVIADGQTFLFTPSADTYVSAGDNKFTNYGQSDLLYIQEAVDGSEIPFGNDTKRPYLRFSLKGINSGANITSIKFHIYARNMDENKKKKIYIFKTTNEKEFIENSFVWNDHNPSIINEKETGYIFKEPAWHQDKWGLDEGWISAIGRLTMLEVLIQRYLATKDERFAYTALEILMSKYKWLPEMPATDILSHGWRTEYILMTFFGAMDSEYMTPEVLTAILKCIYAHGAVLYNGTSTVANWACAIRTGFTRVCGFTPELIGDDWWQHAKERLAELYTDYALHPDGSYRESCSGYISVMIKESALNLKIIDMVEGNQTEAYSNVLAGFRNLLRYLFDLRMPYGYTPAFGDGPRSGPEALLRESLKVDPNPEIEYIVTSGERGTEPNYTSKLYPYKGVISMRSGWGINALSAFINNDHGGTHHHYDDLSLDIYAYGHPLLVDSGNSSYTEKAPDAATSKDTISHNTIEIDGKNQTSLFYGTQQNMSLATNKSFDFIEANTPDSYKGFDVTRKVLFLKNRCWIVSDYIIPVDNGEHTYNQAWHPDKGNYVTISEYDKSAWSGFSARPNISIVPADAETLNASVNTTYMTFAGVSKQRYVKYTKKDVVGPQTFDTVLYPDKIGEKTNVSVQRIDLGNVEKHVATSLEISYDGDTGFYYSSNEVNPTERLFGDYLYDGQMAYVERGSDKNIKMMAITNGKLLKYGETALIKSDEIITDIGVEWNANTLVLNSEEALPDSGVSIYSARYVDRVELNGEAVDFEFKNNIVKTNGSEKIETDIPLTGGSNVGKLQGSSGSGSGGSGSEKVDTPNTENKDDSNNLSSIIPFIDVQEHWAKQDIAEMWSEGIINGIDDDLFAPEKQVTRAEFTAMIQRMLKITMSENYKGIFKDVSKDAWYALVIESAAEHGLVSGSDDGTFNPDKMLQRQEMAKIMINAYIKSNGTEPESNVSEFSDWNMIADWAIESVAYAVKLGLIKGITDNTIDPTGVATRAQAAVIINRLRKLIIKIN